MQLDEFIQALPKAEHHVHLEGTIAWGLARTKIDDDVPVWLNDPAYRFADFADFSAAMQPAVRYLYTTVERYHEVASAYYAKLVAQNVRYVEISFGSGVTSYKGLSIPEIVAALYDAAPDALEVRVIAGMNRRFPPPMNSVEVQSILTVDGIVGIDLHSDERIGQVQDFAPIYAAAHERGMLLRAHAGELRGAPSVRATLDHLKVTRIEHGTRAVEDPALVARLRDENITLDMTPTSNVRLGVVDDFASHPIGALLRQGVRVTCSTDDPAIFGVSLTDELRKLATIQHFTAAELAALQINAFEVALLADDQRQRLIAEVNDLLTRYETANP